MGAIARPWRCGVSFDPTPQQRIAIEAPLGPVLVVAGPGAGKTYCLIGRIDHLIQRLGFEANRICAVTFTNKAAEEIGTRLHATLGAAGTDVTRGTIHALCLSLLREFPEEAGIRQGFGVADEEYQRRVLRRLRVRQERLGQLLQLFGRHRLQGYVLTGGDLDLYHRYSDMLRARNLVDFDDLVYLTEALLRTHDSVAQIVGSRWCYLLVDEFQDLNVAQYGILKRLAAGHHNLFVVGDDEQSIFSWTGADPRILDHFAQDFGVSQPIVLDYNRRCSVQIFDVARRLILRNPTTFPKRIEAQRESPYDVQARLFPDEEAEAEWLIRDLLDDRARERAGWGDYAILYRNHRIGQFLEGKLLGQGVPCRLAKGQALLDDDIVGYVVACLRVIRGPADPLAVEALAERLLPPALLQDVHTLSATSEDLLTRLRIAARLRPKGDAGGKKIWRFIYHVENLRVMERSHDTLVGVVNELLSQRVGPARNPLEEQHHDLSDPLAYPGAGALADRLRAASSAGTPVWLEPDRGVEVGLVGMLRAAGIGPAARLTERDVPGPTDLVLRPGDAREGHWPLLLFKALQSLHAPSRREEFRNYVTFDLETTDKDVATCGIVEIAAVRVRDGRVVDRFQSLVACTGPISAGATATHGYVEADLRGAPSFADVWPRFRVFVGDDVLVAHNGQQFDVPLLRRAAEPFGGLDGLSFYDTLPLCRSLEVESAKLGDLARRYGIAQGRAHHALDDALMLAGLLPHLKTVAAMRARKASQVQLLDYLGLSLALDGADDPTPEEVLLLDLARPYALGKYSDCLDFYGAELASGIPDAPTVDEVIRRLGGHALLQRLRTERSPAERYPAAVARLRVLMDLSQGTTLAEQIDDLLARAALSSHVGVETDPHRLNLLTLHSTKGLEFSRVYIVGVEDYLMPGWKALQEEWEHDIQEARRLLYVGMTRAQDRLVLTCTERRWGSSSGGNLFLTEAGLAPLRSVRTNLS